MRILMLGGTGAMGVHMVNLLLATDSEIVVTSRKSLKANTKVKYIQGNAQDIEFLKSILNNKWDVIIDFMVYSTAVFKERIDLLLGSTSQYIFLSTARVYADTNGLINEKSARLLDTSNDKDFLETDHYPLTKARQENILKKSPQINWTIIRPYITYAENRLQLGVLEKEDWLYRALKGKTIVFQKSIVSKLTTLTYGYDVAKAIISIIGKEKALGEIFNVSTSESKSWSYILDIYLEVLEEHLGFRPNVLMPISSNYKKSNASYSIIYDRLYNRKFDNSKIMSFFNDDFTPLDCGLKTSISKFLKNPVFKEINWRVQANMDKQAREFTSLKIIPGFKNKIKYLLFRYIYN